MGLLDILSNGNGDDDLKKLWDTSEAADDFKPLPDGAYVCHAVDGVLDKSRQGTPGYKITFKVLEPSEHAGRLIWHDCWLTPAAMPQSKRDLGKLGIQSLEQLQKPLPRFIRCKVKIALRTDDDGTQRNRVKTFEAVGFDKEPVDPFAPSEQPEAITQEPNQEGAGNV